MGRRRIPIRQIVDPKLRHITFNKRKNGLLKKAAELALLCNVNMLLLFQDEDGNLIQFSKNKIANIPAFFQECQFHHVMQFNAEEYPNFFKVNHYKKRIPQDRDDLDQDDMDLGDALDTKTAENDQMMSEGRNFKRERLSGASHLEDEIFHSGSDESSDEEDDDLTSHTETQPAMQMKNAQGYMTTKKVKSDEKPQMIMSNDHINQDSTNEQESLAPQIDYFQSYKEIPQRVKPMDYNQQLMGFECPFKRNVSVADPENSSFGFCPFDNNNGANQNANFSNNPNYIITSPYMDAKNSGNGQMKPQCKMFKRDKLPGTSNMQEEDHDNSQPIYQSGSEGFTTDGEDHVLTSYTEIQLTMQKKKIQASMKTKKGKNDEKPQKIVNNNDQINGGLMNEQEAFAPQKDHHQSFKKAPQRVPGNNFIDYNQQLIGFEHPFKRNAPVADQGEFYPSDNNNAVNFVNNPNYMTTNPCMPNKCCPNCPSAYSNAKSNSRSFAITGTNPFINRQANKPEVDEKLMDNANMIKYMNGIGASGHSSQKMYNYPPPEAGRFEDAEPMPYFRSNYEGPSYEYERDYCDYPPQYGRGFENNTPSNLPFAYFNSKKFNFDGYGKTFEDNRFNEFRGNGKRKLRQGQ